MHTICLWLNPLQCSSKFDAISCKTSFGQIIRMPALVVLLVVQLVAVRANSIIKSHLATHDRSEELMRGLSVVDISDRNMNTWWDQFSISWAKYDLKVKDDPNLYCSSPNALLTELGELKSKVA